MKGEIKNESWERERNCIFQRSKTDELAAKRCAFIVDHQQYHGKIKELQGAYLPYDNEEKILVCTPENDFNAGRERTGMGVLIARALQQNLLKDREKAEPSSRSPFLNSSMASSRIIICMKRQSATGTATGSENAEYSVTLSHTTGAPKTAGPSNAMPA